MTIERRVISGAIRGGAVGAFVGTAVPVVGNLTGCGLEWA